MTGWKNSIRAHEAMLMDYLQGKYGFAVPARETDDYFASAYDHFHIAARAVSHVVTELAKCARREAQEANVPLRWEEYDSYRSVDTVFHLLAWAARRDVGFDGDRLAKAYMEDSAVQLILAPVKRAADFRLRSFDPGHGSAMSGDDILKHIAIQQQLWAARSRSDPQR